MDAALFLALCADDGDGDRVVRYAAKRDWMEEAIVRALEAIGIDVFRCNSAHLPDLLTHSRGTWLPIEVKGPSGKLTKGQAAMYQRAKFPVVRSVAEALSLFGVHDQPRPPSAAPSLPVVLR